MLGARALQPGLPPLTLWGPRWAHLYHRVRDSVCIAGRPGSETAGPRLSFTRRLHRGHRTFVLRKKSGMDFKDIFAPKSAYLLRHVSGNFVKSVRVYLGIVSCLWF